MRLITLYLWNFRNYRETVVHFSKALNVLSGKNAQGKTNLLEAISVLMTGRSFRTPHLTDLVFFGASGFYLEAHFEKDQIEQSLKFSFDGTQRKIILNDTPLPSSSALLGQLIGVILSPEDHELVKGPPAFRRQFLDLQIAKSNPLYLYHFSRYLRALKYRNLLLRKQNTTGIEAWEHEMAKSAAFITLQRKETVMELEKESHPLQTHISGSIDRLQLKYKSSACQAFPEGDEGALTAYFISQFVKHRARELFLGNTLTGPHRDDFHILVQEKEARLFASEGQQRSCVAALRLAEWNRLKAMTGEIPLMCLDDVGISLDQEREKALYQGLNDLGQVFVTTPKEEVPFPSHRLHVEAGSIACLEESHC